MLSHQATMLVKRTSPMNGMAMPATMNITPTTCKVVGKRERGAANHRAEPEYEPDGRPYPESLTSLPAGKKGQKRGRFHNTP